jgi:hypothetical protein
MTIEVYKINPETGARTQVSRKRTVKPADAPEVAREYPPCACPRCNGRGSRGRLHAQVSDANRRSRGEA